MNAGQQGGVSVMGNMTVVLVSLLLSVVAWGQLPAGGRTAQTSTNSSTPTNCSGGALSAACGGGPSTQRPVFLSGKVILTDGSPPPEAVKIERTCAGSVHLEGYTDQKGRFNFEVGRTTEIQDVSDTQSPLGPGFGNPRGDSGGSTRGSGMDRRLYGCEIRAVMAGYRSDSISLSSERYLDNPDVGSIVLHRIGNSPGLTISATSALAPKDAQKAYTKGLDATVKGKNEEAKTNFEKAVALYPRYAAAWVALGKWNEENRDFDAARKDYAQALEADSKYVPPYERLSSLGLKDEKWQDLADFSAKMISLDPLNYPGAFYMSGVANLQLKQYDVAEKSIREAIRLDPSNKFPRSQYVLGLVLAEKHEYRESAESLRAFLAASPTALDADFVRKQLAQVEEAAKQ